MNYFVILTVFAALAGSAQASDLYQCHVAGAHKNLDGEIAKIEHYKLSLASGETIKFRGWRLRLAEIRDGGQQVLALTLNAPNQNGSVGMAYAELGSRYIGFIQGMHLEALCKRAN